MMKPTMTLAEFLALGVTVLTHCLDNGTQLELWQDTDGKYYIDDGKSGETVYETLAEALKELGRIE